MMRPTKGDANGVAFGTLWCLGLLMLCQYN